MASGEARLHANSSYIQRYCSPNALRMEVGARWRRSARRALTPRRAARVAGAVLFHQVCVWRRALRLACGGVPGAACVCCDAPGGVGSLEIALSFIETIDATYLKIDPVRRAAPRRALADAAAQREFDRLYVNPKKRRQQQPKQ